MLNEEEDFFMSPWMIHPQTGNGFRVQVFLRIFAGETSFGGKFLMPKRHSWHSICYRSIWIFARIYINCSIQPPFDIIDWRQSELFGPNDFRSLTYSWSVNGLHFNYVPRGTRLFLATYSPKNISIHGSEWRHISQYNSRFIMKADKARCAF